MCKDASDCCRTTAKVLLIIVNIIFWLAGLLMLAFGIAIVAAPGKVISSLSNLGENEFDNMANASKDFYDLVRACGIFMIIMGGIVAIIACFGFFGACCESRCMLVTYAVILIIIVLAEVALIIFAAVFPDKFENSSKKAFYNSLRDTFKRDYNLTGDSFKNDNGLEGEAFWNTIQWKWECCGVYDYKDYSTNFTTWKDLSCDGTDCTTEAVKQKVPLSCCKLNDPKQTPTKTSDYADYNKCITDVNPTFTNTKGCGNAVKDLIVENSKVAIGIAAGIVGLELILIALAFVLCCMWSDRSGKYV